MKKVAILGSTGSIGKSALDILAGRREAYQVVGLAAAGNHTPLLAEQIKRFDVKCVSVANESARDRLKREINDTTVDILTGDSGNETVATLNEVGFVLSAIVGFAGVKSTLAALKSGKTVGLANKESIVAAGDVLLKAENDFGGMMIPVDSEHSAIFQVLGNSRKVDKNELNQIVLTASGGPFHLWPKSDFEKITKEQALNHPTWNMGAKITIDSATMANKGLEVIEATRLFDVAADKVSVVVHPESIVHSMVSFVDGSVMAQLGISDMKGPIGHALAFPERFAGALEALDLAKIGKLTFAPPDLDKFRCLKLAFDAASEGQSMPLAFNAANEVCVERFLNETLHFNDIPRFIESTMEKHDAQQLTDVDSIIELDERIRRLCSELIDRSNLR